MTIRGTRAPLQKILTLISTLYSKKVCFLYNSLEERICVREFVKGLRRRDGWSRRFTKTKIRWAIILRDTSKSFSMGFLTKGSMVPVDFVFASFCVETGSPSAAYAEVACLFLIWWCRFAWFLFLRASVFRAYTAACLQMVNLVANLLIHLRAKPASNYDAIQVCCHFYRGYLID